MSNVSFEVSGGTVLRNGEPIADYDETTGLLDFYPDKARFRAPVVSFLKGMNLPVETGTVSKKSKAPASQPQEASQDASEAPGDGEVAKAMEVLRKAGKLPDAASSLEDRLASKVKVAPPGERIIDPEAGWVRG